MIGGTELKVGIGDMKFSRGEGRIIKGYPDTGTQSIGYDPSFPS